MEIHIRNMVCARCIKEVTGIFREAGVEIKDIRKVTLFEDLLRVMMNLGMISKMI